MATWKYAPDKYNGTAIVASSIVKAYFLVTNSPVSSVMPADPVEVQIPGYGTQDTGRADPKPATWRLRCQLSDVNETDIQYLQKTFSQDFGLAELTVIDGDAVTWAVDARVIAIEHVAAHTYDVILRVPRPIWREATANTHSALNQSGDSISISLTTVRGTRKNRPAFAITPDLAKTDTVDDYAFQVRGVVLPPASGKPYVNRPIYLMDVLGAASRLATDSSATGATVKQTTGSTTITADIAAGATAINLTSAASWPTRGIGYITDNRGNPNNDQFYYTGKSANQLTGVVWLAASASGGSSSPGGTVITAGGIAHTIAQVTSIQPSGCLLSGDDCRVWFDDREVERTLVAWNTAASDVVVNESLPPRVALTAKTAITAAFPANGGTIEFSESTELLAESGYLALVSGAALEIVWYAAKTSYSVTGVQRARWGTTAMATPTSIVANPVRVIVAMGKGKAGVAPCTIQRRPCIQLPGSSNQTWKWGDEADDASTVFYDSRYPARTAMWQPRYEEDGNTGVMHPVCAPMDQTTHARVLQFKDDYAGEGRLDANAYEIDLPQGVSTAASAITADWTPLAQIINLEMFGRDASGLWRLLDQLQQAAAAAGRTLTPTAKMYGIKLKGRYNVGAGYNGTLGNTGNSGDIANTGVHPDNQYAKAEAFSTTKPLVIYAVAVYMVGLTGSQPITLEIFPTTNGYPQTSGDSLQSRFRASQTITNVAGWFIFTLATPVYLPPGTWGLVAYRSSTVSVVNWYGSGLQEYGNGQGWKRETATSGDWDTTERGDFAFMLLTRYDNNDEALLEPADVPLKTGTGARTASQASFDKVALKLADPVYVHRIDSSFAKRLYHAVPRITYSGAGFSVDKWMELATSLAVDCDDRTCVYTESGVAHPVAGAIAADTPSEWLQIPYGSPVVITYAEPNMLQTDVVTTYRGERG